MDEPEKKSVNFTVVPDEGVMVPRIYSATDVEVTAPVTVKQDVPRVQTAIVNQARDRGVLEVIIDEQGRIRRHMKVFVNEDAVQDLGAPIRAGDDVTLMQALSAQPNAAGETEEKSAG